MIKPRLFALAIGLTLALIVPWSLAKADTSWIVKCESVFSCGVQSAQCDLVVTVFDRPTTQGSWVGILGIPQGWDRVSLRVSKGSGAETTTIAGPQLPRMAFGGEAVRDLLLAGTTAEIEIFSAGQLLKSCSLSLAGLEDAYRTMSQHLKQ